MTKPANPEITVEASVRCMKNVPGDFPKKKIAKMYYFPPAGTFSAIYSANEFVENKGYSKGSMQRDYPIAIAEGEGIYISKWCNLGSDVSKIGGVILPDPEFREGGALVIFFK